MKTRIIALVTLLTIFCIQTIVAQDEKGKRTYDLKGVETVDINIACQLILVQGETPNMEILGEEYLLKDIETKFRNGKIIITSDRNWKSREDVVVKVEVKDLKQLNIGGAVDMKTLRTLSFPDFKLSVSGVGNIEMGLKSENFKLVCSGVCNMDITGGTENLRISVSGVGNINATEFEAVKADVTNSGVGKINVLVTELLEASVSGIGSIRYAGNPSVSANVSGLGTIRKY
jgi:hypothetical protein